MHPLQKELLELVRSKDLHHLSLREIAEKIHRKNEHPQKIKHHLEQLEKKGLIRIDRFNNRISSIRSGVDDSENGVLQIPVLGLVHCATDLSVTERFQNFLTISEKILSRTSSNKEDLFALKAVGQSMNRAKINGKQSITEGDYLIVDPNIGRLANGDYVVAEIDGVLVGKKYFESRDNNKCILLLSESERDYHPIVVDASDFHKHMLRGKIIDVVSINNFALAKNKAKSL